MSKFRFEHITLPQAIEFLAWRKLNAMYQDELFKDTIICQRVVTLAQESAAEHVSGEIAGQPLNEEMLMPIEREAPKMGSFFKFTELGQSVAGKVAKYDVHPDNGPFVTLSPVIIWPSRNGQPQQFLTCAVGLSRDLSLKVHKEDVGKYISMSFREREPTTKGSPLKRFRVEELSLPEITELANGNVDKSKKMEPYTTQANVSDDPSEGEVELPF